MKNILINKTTKKELDKNNKLVVGFGLELIKIKDKYKLINHFTNKYNSIEIESVKIEVIPFQRRKTIITNNN